MAIHPTRIRILLHVDLGTFMRCVTRIAALALWDVGVLEAAAAPSALRVVRASIGGWDGTAVVRLQTHGLVEPCGRSAVDDGGQGQEADGDEGMESLWFIVGVSSRNNVCPM